MILCKCENCNKEWTEKDNIEMSIRNWVSFDYMKDLDYMRRYIMSSQYHNLLKQYLIDEADDKISEIKVNKIIMILYNSMKSGESMINVQKKINQVINDKERAKVIARTETMRISNESKLLAYKDKGVEKVKWISMPGVDKRVCEKCRPRDGKIYLLKGWKQEQRPPLHVNCRCSYIDWWE